MALKRSYRALRGLLRVFTPRMKTIWDVPWDGEPCVLCPNHDRAWGPIDMCVHFDRRDIVRPWYNAGVIDRKGLPAYVRNDSWWNPDGLLAPLWNATVPYAVSWVLPPVIRSTPGIPVYYDTKVYQTFKDTLAALKDGDIAVIFAQFPNGYQSHAEHLSRGFLLIGPMAWRRLKLKLKFYPVHVDHRAHTIHVLAPAAYDPEQSEEENEARILACLERDIHD